VFLPWWVLSQFPDSLRPLSNHVSSHSGGAGGVCWEIVDLRKMELLLLTHLMRILINYRIPKRTHMEESRRGN
jgi:hypothetical protein